MTTSTAHRPLFLIEFLTFFLFQLDESYTEMAKNILPPSPPKKKDAMMLSAQSTHGFTICSVL